MSWNGRLNRRAFLKNAGVTALAGTVGAGASMAAIPTGITQKPAGPKYDFDEVYSRIGTDCTKWNRQIERFGVDIQVGMGVADVDFRAAPCINNSFTFKAASKSFSISPMKSAWFFSTHPDYLARVRANNRTDLTTLGMVANRAALREGEDLLDQLLPYIDGNHDFVEAYVRDKMPLVRYKESPGNVPGLSRRQPGPRQDRCEPCGC